MTKKTSNYLLFIQIKENLETNLKQRKRFEIIEKNHNLESEQNSKDLIKYLIFKVFSMKRLGQIFKEIISSQNLFWIASRNLFLLWKLAERPGVARGK